MNATGTAPRHRRSADRRGMRVAAGAPTVPTAPPATALLIEPDALAAHALGATLTSAGYAVTRVQTCADGLDHVATHRPAVVVIGAVGHDERCLDFCQQTRARSSVPVFVVGTSDDEQCHVRALDAGADGYLVRPVRGAELLARMRAVCRRADVQHTAASPTVAFGDVEIDLARRLVTRAGDPVRLSRLEYELLAELARNADFVIPSQQLLTAVWGPARTEERHYLHVYIARLRAKLERDPSDPEHLVAEHRLGYRLRSSSSRPISEPGPSGSPGSG